MAAGTIWETGETGENAVVTPFSGSIIDQKQNVS
jgi:hypothetical protein